MALATTAAYNRSAQWRRPSAASNVRHHQVTSPVFDSPSIWLYVILALASAVLIALAFTIAGRADWTSLLLNVAAGLITALVVLVVVERRIRRAELAILMQTPARARFSLRLLVDPATRAAQRYARTLAEGLGPLILHRAPVDRLDQMEDRLLKGANLLGEPGSGKTLWLMYVAARQAHGFLSSHGKSKLSVHFSLRRWPDGQSLEAALLDHIQSVSSCLTWSARRLMKKHVGAVLLDGYDEIFMDSRNLSSSLVELQEAFPGLAVSVSFRPNYPTPLMDRPIIEMPRYTDQEVESIRTRILTRRMSERAEC